MLRREQRFRSEGGRKGGKGRSKNHVATTVGNLAFI